VPELVSNILSKVAFDEDRSMGNVARRWLIEVAAA
jgi:hypothetical protein